MVMAVVGILASIVFSISSGVRNAQLRTQAKAELSVIAQALEAFKSSYGDYPHIESTADPDSDPATENDNPNANLLLKALTGWSELTTVGNSDPTMTDRSTPRQAYLDTSRMGLPEGETMPENALPGPEIYLVDPWGNPYVYVYNIGSGSWDNFGYLLMSPGPDGIVDLGSAETDGLVDQEWRELAANTDNIFLGEE